MVCPFLPTSPPPLPQGHGRISGHKPELLLNNFNTRLGRRVGRMLGSLFHQDPQFRGRRVVTFHNQRDFIFFRWGGGEGTGVLPAVEWACIGVVWSPLQGGMHLLCGGVSVLCW